MLLWSLMDTLQAHFQIVKAIEDARHRDGLSINGMARRLGVSHSTLVLLRQGKRRPGEKLLRALLVSLPELRPVVMEYMGNGHDTD